jgi:hypothetical protein
MTVEDFDTLRQLRQEAFRMDNSPPGWHAFDDIYISLSDNPIKLKETTND